MSEDHIKTKLFALADAIGISLDVDDNRRMAGSCKRDIELFEGYSPTIITDVEWGSVDDINEVVVAGGRIWGNLGFVCVVERTRNQVSFFVLDRSKRPNTTSAPISTTKWSRYMLYAYLAECCKKVYYRSMFDTVWEELDGASQKLKDYVKFRDQKMPSRDAYETVWGK